MGTPSQVQSQQATPSQAPAAAPQAEAPSKTKQMVQGAQGFDEQSRLLEPAEAGAKDEAPKDDMPGPEKLSPLREAVLEQFRILEGKGIGDAEFEAVCEKTWWEERKATEKANKKWNEEVLPGLVAEWDAKCKADPTYAKANKKPMRKDDSNFTTCIAAQGQILKAAFKAVGLHTKKAEGAGGKWDLFGYATMGRIEATKRGAWHPGKVNDGERPKAGDVLVLEMRGAPDKVQKDIDGESSEFGMFGQSQKKLEKEIAKLKLASQGANAAASQAAAVKLPEVEAKLSELRAKHDEKIAALQVKLDEARAKMQATAGTEKETKGGGRQGGLEFSHVGLFQSMSAEVDNAGKATGREIWTTFDGGQHVPGKIDAQGAKSTTRLYDPATNEIGSAKKGADGIMTQDGKTRWLGGWVNIDDLVDPASKKA